MSSQESDWDYLKHLRSEYFSDLRLYRHGSDRYEQAHTELFQELMMNSDLDFSSETTDICKSVTRGDVEEAWEKLRTYLEADGDEGI